MLRASEQMATPKSVRPSRRIRSQWRGQRCKRKCRSLAKPALEERSDEGLGMTKRNSSWLPYLQRLTRGGGANGVERCAIQHGAGASEVREDVADVELAVVV